MSVGENWQEYSVIINKSRRAGLNTDYMIGSSLES